MSNKATEKKDLAESVSLFQTEFDETFFAQDDTQYAVMRVPEWPNTRPIRLGSLTADQLVAWFETNQRLINALKTNDNQSPNDKTNGYRMFVMCLVDNDGNRIGLEADGVTPIMKLVNGFRKKNPAVMARLINKAMALNGLREDDVKERKNDSGEAVPAGSPTDSPLS